MFKKDDQIGPYTLIEKLGKGAFGEVWLAEEKTAISAHRFALKLPNEEEVDLEAIRQEADVWENVKGHPNILPIIKADIYDDQIYIASEYAPGGSLNEWLKEHDGKAPSVDVAVEMTRGILSGLAHLHSKGVIHRDLKPANILLQADTPRIADFGIARLAKSAATGGNSMMSAGTPSYMAPECFYSVRSEQTDIWAVGVLFHKLLTGKLPFSHPDQVSVMNAILNDKPNIDSSIPEQLQAIIRKALQKDTSLRYKSAAEMQNDLLSYVSANISAENIPVIAPPITPQPIPAVEKEEVTVIRPKAKKPRRRIYVRPFRHEDDSPNYLKTIAVALTVLLVGGAVAIWAAIQFSGNSDEKRSTTVDFTNSNRTYIDNRGNSLTPLNQSDSYTSNPTTVNPSVQIPATTQQIPVSTPYAPQSDAPVSNVNIQPRMTQVENPAPETEKTPIVIETPLTPTRKSSTPVQIQPEQTPPSTLPERTSKPTPKPSTAKPEETPPPMPKSNDSPDY